MKIGMILGWVKVKGKVTVEGEGVKRVAPKKERSPKIKGHTAKEIEDINRRIDEAFEQARRK